MSHHFFLFIIIFLSIGLCEGENAILQIDHIEVYSNDNDTQYIPIILYNATNTSGVYTWLRYDPKVICVTGIEEDDLNEQFIVKLENNTKGYVYVASRLNNSSLSGNITVAILEVQLLRSRYLHEYTYINMYSNGIYERINGRNYYQNVTIHDGSITITNHDPMVTNPYAINLIPIGLWSINLIPTDTDNDPLWGEKSLVVVTVWSDSYITSVTANLSVLGGPSDKEMVYNSQYNDYSCETNASGDLLPGTYDIKITATNATGVKGYEYVPLEVCLNGDVMMDDDVDIGDVLGLLSYVMNDIPIDNDFVADVTGDGNINIGDVILLVNHVMYPETYTLR